MRNKPSKKPVEFHGTALDDIKSFPDEAKGQVGYQIDRLQSGLEPSDFKPMTTVGPGVKEIRVKIEDGIFRTIYVAKFEDAVHILHAFQKKTQKTRKQDIEIARRRYRELVMEK